jgi:hypothetical protein
MINNTDYHINRDSNHTNANNDTNDYINSHSRNDINYNDANYTNNVLYLTKQGCHNTQLNSITTMLEVNYGFLYNFINIIINYGFLYNFINIIIPLTINSINHQNINEIIDKG